MHMIQILIKIIKKQHRFDNGRVSLQKVIYMSGRPASGPKTDCDGQHGYQDKKQNDGHITPPSKFGLYRSISQIKPEIQSDMYAVLQIVGKSWQYS